MTIPEKLASLRSIMKRENIDAYIISGSDPHNSEYLPDAWTQRRWISGFTGSYGTVVVTMDSAGLWTDTRYFIQAEHELQNSGIDMHKLRVPEAIDYPQWLYENMPENSHVGFDGFCMTAKQITDLSQLLSNKQIKTASFPDLLGEIWLDRPELPMSPIFQLDEKYAGCSISEKLSKIRETLSITEDNQYTLLSVLDEIAWTFNIRGNDIAYNPVTLSYAVIGKENAWLFIKGRKVSAEIKSNLMENHVELSDYHHLFLFLNKLPKKSAFFIDSSTLNYAVYKKLQQKFTVSVKTSPVTLLKAVKNDTEIAGFRRACFTEGIILTKFFYWLEQNVGSESLTETSVAQKLTSMRKEYADYVGDSFHTISAYKENAALPHYSAKEGCDVTLRPQGFYLIDTGAHFYYGTTDITRTIALGDVTAEEKEDYTLVLRGMINLATAVFPKGTTGTNLDILARIALWQKERNFGHGTGHGIGHVLCVHEGPQDIRQTWRDQAVLAGMVTSDEPGIYREGKYGIRHENMIVCVPGSVNEFGEWLRFETISLCYIDTKAVDKSLMTKTEVAWLNEYNQCVYDKIAPALCEEERVWLQSKTRAI